MLKELDGKAITSEKDFHAAIATALELPGYYGRNLDALWDVMTGDVERPLVLVWKDSQESRAMLGEKFDVIVEILRRVEQQDLSWGLQERFKLRME